MIFYVTENQNNTPRSPLRILVGLLSAKEQLCARASDLGGLFEVRLFRRQVDRAQGDVVTLTGEAGQIIKEETDVTACLRAAMADGVITRTEVRRLKREVSELSVVANLHHAHLRRLV